MKKIPLFITNFLYFCTLLSGFANAAGSAYLSVSPSNNTYTIGDVFDVTIFENGTNIYVVTVKVNYDASKIQCNSVNTSGSAFGGSISASCGGGVAEVSRYTNPNTPALSGSQNVASLNFRAISSGVAVVSFSAGTQITSSGTNEWNEVATGGSFTINAPTPTPTPVPSTPESTQATPASNTPSSTPIVQADQNQASQVDETVVNGDETVDAPTVLGEDKEPSAVNEVVKTTNLEGIKMLLLTLGVMGLIWLSRWYGLHKSSI